MKCIPTLFSNKQNQLILLLLSVLISFSTSVYSQNPNPNLTVDSYINNEMNTEKIPGMSTLIVKDGEIVWKQSYGLADVANNTPVNDDTIFLLASMSKVFTGTALMKLYEDGIIHLDDNINTYLPYSIHNPIFPSTPITFRMLMTHTSSITDGSAMDNYYSIGDPTISLPDVIERYFSTSGADYNASENFSNNNPGTSYDYSNMGTALAGYLVETISGTPFNEYCNTNIFNKLCMENTAWHLADLNTNQIAKPYEWNGSQYVPFEHYGFADYPNGQLRSTINDLANFAITYLQDGAFHSQNILNSTSVNEMLTPQIPSIDNTQGLNWYLEQISLTGGGSASLWGHNGGESGVSTDLYINPSNNIGVVVISNAEGSNENVVQELYNHALTLSTSGVGNPNCTILSTHEFQTDLQTINIHQVSSNGQFHVESKNAPLEKIVAHNTLGQLILKKKTNYKSVFFSIGTKGVYFINIITKSGYRYTTKIIRK